MSSTAVCTPANSGGPRKARSPVCGSRVPIVRVPSPFLAGALELDDELLSLDDELSLLLLAAGGEREGRGREDCGRAPGAGWANH